jgi:hypothetical protein
VLYLLRELQPLRRNHAALVSIYRLCARFAEFGTPHGCVRQLIVRIATDEIFASAAAARRAPSVE